MTTVDTRRDILIGDDRDIRFNCSGDLRMTRNPEEYMANFIAITMGDILRRLIGNPESATLYETARSRTRRRLAANEQIEEVISVDIISINTQTGTVNMDVRVAQDTTYRLEIEV